MAANWVEGGLLPPSKAATNSTSLAPSSPIMAADSPVDPVKGNSVGNGARASFLGWRALARTS